MSLLDEHVKAAMQAQPDYSALRVVIEKEILHHDIFKIMNNHGFLNQVTFIGGTSLRMCHNSARLSEDLDFSLNVGTSIKSFTGFENEIISGINKKYGTSVIVKPPKPSDGDTSTWRISIEKEAHRPDIPRQKINVDVCSVPSLDHENKPLLNHYGLPVPTSGMLIPVQSMQETLADKYVALALRPKIKARDLWDIVWISQQAITVNISDIEQKLALRGIDPIQYADLLRARSLLMLEQKAIMTDFNKEMVRFLPNKLVDATINNPDFSSYLVTEVSNNTKIISNQLTNGPAQTPSFRM